MTRIYGDAGHLPKASFLLVHTSAQWPRARVFYKDSKGTLDGGGTKQGFEALREGRDGK
jgi:hypothetical protein